MDRSSNAPFGRREVRDAGAASLRQLAGLKPKTPSSIGRFWPKSPGSSSKSPSPNTEDGEMSPGPAQLIKALFGKSKEAASEETRLTANSLSRLSSSGLRQDAASLERQRAGSYLPTPSDRESPIASLPVIGRRKLDYLSEPTVEGGRLSPSSRADKIQAEAGRVSAGRRSPGRRSPRPAWGIP